MPPAIEVSHVTKEYRLGAMQSLKQTALNAGARLLGRPVEERPPFKALDDVSFTIEQGEVVGIIGHNGAGKSTLLKMLARISTPTHGSVRVNGRIAPLIEVGAGFVPDFTGRENVYLNGSILGMSKKEIDRKFDEIVDFAEMAEFIDTPVKRYSSGMQVKLAFAVATSVEAEILIVDEVLAVGDLAFQRKCFDRMEDLIKRQHRTVLLVSHNIRQVERLCSRVMMMSRGEMVADGKPKSVCDHFYEQSDQQIKSRKESPFSLRETESRSSGVKLQNVRLLNSDKSITGYIKSGEDLIVVLDIYLERDLINPVFAIGIHTTDLLYIGSERSAGKVTTPILCIGQHEIFCQLKNLPLQPGNYAIRASIVSGELASEDYYGENLANFCVSPKIDYSASDMRGEGFIQLNTCWKIESTPSDSLPQ